MSSVFLSHSPSYMLRQGLLLSLKLADWLGCQEQDPGFGLSLGLLTPTLVLHMCATTCPAFTWVLGT